MGKIKCNSLDKRFSSVKDSEGVATLFQALKGMLNIHFVLRLLRNLTNCEDNVHVIFLLIVESCSSAPLVDVQEP